jgi:acetoin utilization deacetylase AcuC-like enzyme
VAWLDCADSVVKDGTAAFALTRPPGHHATAAQAMGFCFFNFAAAAAMYAVEELGEWSTLCV